MLRSFGRHFNETVFRGPADEGNGGGSEDGDVIDTGDAGGADDSDPGDDGSNEPEPDAKPLSVREQLKKTIAEASGEVPAKPARDKKTGRIVKKEGAEAAPAADPAAPAEPVANATPAPASLPKEAKADWDKAPPSIQQAFLKREQDMQAGVEQLQQRYNLIDQAIAPHQDALRQMNATPGEAVNRMFLWFKALAGKPAEAFPALAQSLGIDWRSLATPQGGAAPDQQQQDPNQPPADPAQQQQMPDISQLPYVKQLEQQIRNLTQQVQQVDGRFGSVEQTINTQNEARTRENLSLWSNGKPHFEAVRQDMAKLIETGIVPLKTDGQVDLDTAYERAIYFNPEVRALVLAEQQQANQQVQQESKAAATTAQQAQVSKARKASVSLSASTTPGQAQGGGIASKKKTGEKLSVRDSLKAAIGELRDQ